ncbi:MAG: VanZ family protein [Planctomycetes bacterium]|nr:VanZ family protein [Planctomycetota bacterium]
MGRRHRSSSRRRISSEPLINFVHQRLEVVMAIATVLFIFYTTLLPTAIDAGKSEHGVSLSAVTSRQDLAQNIALYLPLGFFLALACRRSRMKWWTVALITLISATALSGTAEFVQQFLPARVSSLTDVVCNILGAAAGGLCAYVFRVGSRSFRSKMRDALSHQPMFMTYILAGTIYVVLSFVPFRLDLTPRTHDTLLNPVRLAAFTPTKASEFAPQGHTARGQYDHAIDLAVAISAFVLLAFLACGSLQGEFGFGEITAGLATLWMIFFLSVSIVLGRMFIHTLGFQIIFIPAAFLGATVGILASWTSLRTRLRAWPQVAAWAWSAVLFCLAVIVARELSPYEFDFESVTIADAFARMTWIPFRQYFSDAPTAGAVGDILAKFGRFLVFGILISVALKSGSVRPFRSRLRRCCWISFLLAMMIEFVQTGCPGRYSDITHVLLAVGGALAGAIALEWWSDLIKASRPQRDDRATSLSLTL